MSDAALPTVLFVDDEERILRSLRMLFRGRANVLATTSGREAIEWVAREPVHVVVSDQRMPEIGGVEVLRAVAERSPGTLRILLTGYADLDAVTASVNDGEIFRFVEKPWNPDYLVDVVGQAARIATPTAPTSVVRAPETMPPADARVLVLDADRATCGLARELLPAALPIDAVDAVEPALAALAERDYAILVCELSGGEDVAGLIKQLKRLSPATLAIVTTPLRDSRLIIDLINQGQIFRFLPKPLSRELLRRSLTAALERHLQLRAHPLEQRRHAVDAPSAAPASMPARLLHYWRRIREAAQLRAG